MDLAHPRNTPPARGRKSGLALFAIAVAVGCSAAPVGEPAATPPNPGTASNDQAPGVEVNGWVLVYDNLSAFHLDGEYLRYTSDGEYVAQMLIRTPDGVQERIYRGQASDSRLGEPFTRELHTGVEALAFDRLISPPERTLIPDQVVTSLQLTRTSEGKSQTATLNFVLGAAADKLTPEGEQLFTLAKQTLAQLRAAPADVTKENVSAPAALPR